MPSGQLSLYCEGTPVAEATYDAESDRNPVAAVVEALAAAEGVDPLELEPLHHSIDAEALERLFRTAGRSDSRTTVLSHAIDGWNLFVRSDGRVVVCDADSSKDPAPVFETSDS